MPKYFYKCNSCFECFEVFHGMTEDYESCNFCESTNIHRVPQSISIKRQETKKDGQIGDEVKRAIEENRAILKEERQKRVELKDGD